MTSSPHQPNSKKEVRTYPVRPKMELGISIHQKIPNEEELKQLKSLFKSEGKKCAACGVTLTKEMVKHHFEKNRWFNVCGMCHCASNLDRIPHFERGHVVWFPYMSQPRLNAVLRGLWSAKAMSGINADDNEYQEMINTLDEIVSLLANRPSVTEEYYSFSDVDVVSSMLFLLTDEEYEKRGAMLEDFRWLPNKQIFEDEMPAWGSKDYSGLHPKKITSNITKFMTKYCPDFTIKQ
jgi:hypothetical protein